jgi:hypothetical protein
VWRRATVPIWPAWSTFYARGPEAARTVSIEPQRSAQQRGRGWLAPLHLFGPRRHSLRKLNLRSRVELATTVARNRA